jgi:hypothetical protein
VIADVAGDVYEPWGRTARLMERGLDLVEARVWLTPYRRRPCAKRTYIPEPALRFCD